MSEPRQKFVLFDFDGVIANSFALAFEVSRQFNPELDEAKYKALFEGNVYESLKKHEGDRYRDRSAEYFSVFMPRFMKETELVEGMPEVVRALSQTYALAIISSTITSPITEFPAAYDLAGCFGDVMGKDVHASKIEKMRMLFEKHGIGADDCVFITDTLGDMREAEAHGMGAIGVAWGWHSRETLQKGVPFRIVEKPEELPDAVADYFAPHARGSA